MPWGAQRKARARDAGQWSLGVRMDLRARGGQAGEQGVERASAQQLERNNAVCPAQGRTEQRGNNF